METLKFDRITSAEVKKADLPDQPDILEILLTAPLKQETVLMSESLWDDIMNYEEIENMRGINDLTMVVDRKRVLELVKKNRITHEQDFKDACLAYQRRCVEILSNRRNEIQQISTEDVQKMREADLAKLMIFSLPHPRNFLAHYDQVIGALELSVEDKLELTGRQINAWCHDRWEWQDEFANSTLQFK